MHEPHPPLPLEGLYLHLVRQGFLLSIRDYEAALSALRRGYGLPRREDLQWLCTTLWARTDQEVAALDRLFREFPRPTPEEVRTLAGDRAPLPDRDASEGSGAASGRRTSSARENAPTVEFAAPTQSGVGLPRVIVRERASEPYLFAPRPLLSTRALTVAWRRFRLAVRTGPRVELDLAATVAEQCRSGRVLAPTLIPARRNQAQLFVLFDISPSMITWRDLIASLGESLSQSQLARAVVNFFDNVPDMLSASASPSPTVSLTTQLAEHAQSPLLIISDAGATRGRRNPERIATTRELVKQIRAARHPVAWLNPMRRARWAGTSAQSISRLHGLPMFELTEDGLTHAVDCLRGTRNA